MIHPLQKLERRSSSCGGGGVRAKDWEVEATVVEGEGEQGSSRDVDGGQFQPC